MSWKQSRSGKGALGNLRSTLATLLFLALNSAVRIIAADADHCAVCGATHGETVYAVTDRAAARKVLICYSCVTCADECYVCGLPVPKDPLKLSDGRCLCERDRKTVILEEEKAQRISEEVRDGLDRQFSRFLSLPSTNVTVRLVDRVDLYEEFAVTGNNFECPEILGYIHAKTNRGGMTHSISLMTALQEAEFRATCAHEYAHAWLFENVSTARRKALSRDAQEGFCELLAYLLMDAIQQGDQMERMLRNTYTRGQIQLFIAAEREYGINEVLD